MKHYVRPGIAKALASKVVELKVKLGLLRISNRRQYREEVVKEAHAAFLSL